MLIINVFFSWLGTIIRLFVPYKRAHRQITIPIRHLRLCLTQPLKSSELVNSRPNASNCSSWNIQIKISFGFRKPSLWLFHNKIKLLAINLSLTFRIISYKENEKKACIYATLCVVVSTCFPRTKLPRNVL